MPNNGGNDDLSILITAQLNTQVSLGLIQEQLNEMAKSLKLEISTVSFDTNALKAFEDAHIQAFQNIQKAHDQMHQQMQSNMQKQQQQHQQQMQQTQKQHQQIQQQQEHQRNGRNRNETPQNVNTTYERNRSQLSGEGYADLASRVNELRDSTDQYARLVVNTGANMNNLKSATIEYTNALGQLVREYMQLEVVENRVDEANVQRTESWKTTGFQVVDDKQATQKIEDKQNAALDNFSATQLARMQKLQDASASGILPEDVVNNAKNMLDSLSVDSSKVDNKALDLYLQTMVKLEQQLQKTLLAQNAFNTKLDAIRESGQVDAETIDKVQQAINGLNTSSTKLDFQNINNQIKALNQQVSALDGSDVKVSNLMNRLSQLQFNAQNTSGVTNQESIDRAINSYQEIVTELGQIKNADQVLTNQQLAGYREKIQAIQNELTLQKQYEQQQKSMQLAIGQKQIGSMPVGFDYQSSNVLDQMKAVISQQLSSSKGVGVQSVDWKSSTQDAATFVAKMQQVGETYQEVTVKVNALNGAVVQMGEKTNEAANRSLGVLTQMLNQFSHIPAYLLATNAVHFPVDFFKEGLQYVTDYNAALTQIGTATGYTGEKITELSQNFHQLSQDMSTTTDALTQGALEFYRQGLNDSQVVTNLTTTIEYAKISGLDFQQSVDLLTAASNGMSVAVKQADGSLKEQTVTVQHAADVFTFLGDATATGADEIGQAFQKVSGTAGQLGVPFEKMASMIATVSASTRTSATTIGDSFNSILARMASIKEKGFDSTDGTTVNQVAKALNTIGVSLTDQNGNFNDFGTVIDQIGKKWDTLSKKQQAYISTTIAGTYQQSRFLDLMNHFGQYQDLANQAMDSGGTTAQKYNIYLGSLQAKMDALKAAEQNLWTDMFNTDSMKGGIETLTSLVDVLDKLQKELGVVVTAGTPILSLIMGMTKSGQTWRDMLLGSIPVVGKWQQAVQNAMKTGSYSLPKPIEITTTTQQPAQQETVTVTQNQKKAIDDLVQSEQKLQSETVNVATETTKVSSATDEAIVETEGMTTAVEASTIAMNAARIGAYALEASLTFGLSLAITAVIQGLTTLISKYEQTKAVADQAKKDADSMGESYYNNKQTIDSLVESINKLSSQQNLSAQDQQTLIEQSNQLNILMPQLTTYVDSASNAHIKLGKAQKDVLNTAQQLSTQWQGDFTKNAQDSISKLADAYNTLKQEHDKALINASSTTVDNINDSPANKATEELGPVQKTQEQINADKAEEQSLNESLQYQAEQIRSTYLSAADQLTANNQKLQLTDKNLQNILDKVKQTGAQDVVKDPSIAAAKLQAMLKTAQDLANVQDFITKNMNAINGTGGTTPQEQSDAMAKLDVLLKAVSQDTGASLSSLQQMLRSTTQGFSDAADQAQTFQEDMGSLNNEFVKYLDQESDINTAIDKMNSGHQLTANEIESLINKHKDLAGSLQVVNGQLYLSQDALTKVRDSELDEFKTFLDNQQKMVDAQKASLQSRLTLYGMDLQAFTNTEAAKAQLVAAMAQKQWSADHSVDGKPMYGPITPAESSSENQKNGNSQAVDDMASEIQAMNQYQDQLNKMKDQLTTGMNTINTSDQISGGMKAATDQTSKFVQQLNDLDLALQKIKDEMAQYPNDSQKYRDALQSEINLLQQKNGLLNKAINNPTKYLSDDNSLMANSSPDVTTAVDSSVPSSNIKSVRSGYTGQYSDVINAAAARYNIDPNWLASILMQESGITPNWADGRYKISSAGAIGIAQFMPSTAASLGVNPYDTDSSINGAAKYLSQLYNQFGGNMQLATAGYNAGGGNAEKALSQGWAETTNYVDMVNSYYKQFSAGQGGAIGLGNSASNYAGNNAFDPSKLQSRLDQYKQTLSSNQAEILKLKQDIEDSYIASYDNYAKSLADDEKQSEAAYKSLNSQTSSYAQSFISRSISDLQQQQKVVHAEAEQIRNSGYENLPQYAQKLRDLGQAWLDLQNNINQLKQQHLDDILAPMDNGIKTLEDNINVLKDKIAEIKFTSGNEFNPQETTDQSQIIESMRTEQQIVANEADAIRRSGLYTDQNMQKLQELGQQWWSIQQNIDQAQQTMVQNYVQLLKDAYEQQRKDELATVQQQQKNLDEYHTKYIQNLDDQMQQEQTATQDKLQSLQRVWDAQNYQDNLNKDEESRQQLQDEINGEMLDKSAAGKSKLADLTKQLADQEDKINKEVADNQQKLTQQQIQDKLNADQKATDAAKKAADDQYNNQKEALQNEMDAINAKYDAIAEDQSKWNKITQDLMNGNIAAVQQETQGVISGLSNFANNSAGIVQNHIEQVKSMIDELEQAVQGLPQIGATGTNPGNPSSDISQAMQAVLNKQQTYGQMWNAATTQAGKDLAHVLAVQGLTQNGDIMGLFNQSTNSWSFQEGKLQNMSQLQEVMAQIGQAWAMSTNQSDKDKLHNLAYQIGSSYGATYNSGAGTWDYSKVRFDTGGMTGSWGASPRFALLDEKELVLNAQDTSNLLSAVNIVRSIAGNLKGGTTTNNNNGNSVVIQNLTIQAGSGAEGQMAANSFISELRKLGFNPSRTV